MMALLVNIACLFVALALSVLPVSAAEIQLIPELDQFGTQIGVYYFWGDADGERSSFAVYDTGASVSTRSAAEQLTDQILYELNPISSPGPIPTETSPDGTGSAVANALGDTIVGDISAPGTLSVLGVGEVTFDPVTLEVDFDLSTATTVQNTRLFLGTAEGSPNLPSIAGMNLHAPTAARPDGTESLTNLQGFVIDFVELFPEVFPPEVYTDGLKVSLPDTEFAATGELSVTPTTETTAAFRIPLGEIGESVNGAGVLSVEPNPTIEGVTIAGSGLASGLALFDTGAQLTAADPNLLAAAGVDLGDPQFSIDVQGAGSAFEVFGYIADITIPLDSAIHGTEVLTFLDAPVFALPGLSDLGIDIIAGMNLFNTTSEFLFSPYDPLGSSLTVTFFNDPDRITDLSAQEELAVGLLAEAFPAVGVLQGESLPTFNFQADEVAMPEPSSLALFCMGAVGIGCGYRRKRRRSH